MNALDQLNSYLQRIEKRLRFMALSRGTALTAVSALIVTLLLVVIINRFAFSPGSLLFARIVLFLAVAAAIGFGLVVPLLRMNRRQAARKAEHRFPQFEERLLTLAEKENARDPFLQLLAGDAMKVAQDAKPDRLAPRGPIIGFLTSAGLAVVVLLWLILAGPGYLGYGTSLLWAGPPRAGAQPFYDIAVTPGDRTVRRKADQLVTAELIGFDSPKVRLYAQYNGTSKWEPVLMQVSPHASTYEFMFSGLTESVEYYVEAGAVHSKHYTLKVVDLPAVKKIRVTYHYPKWTGLKDETEDPGGDLRAVEGTEAEVAVETDKPLAKGSLVLGDDQQLALTSSQGNWLTARVPISKDGMYHIAALEGGENVRLSDDYFIEARKDNPPNVKIVRPGRDAKVNPIEEVEVNVNADDDFGLSELNLHYSVNAGPEKVVPLLSHKGAKTAEAKYTLALEDFKLSPGDVVSMYATAKDARTPAKTDIFFIEAQPFERNYSQAQEMGGGGMNGAGGDDNGNELSQRQKEIIAATWNEVKGGAKDPKAAADAAKFLSDVQGKLGAQAKSLSDRMRARGLAETNPQFQTFVKAMDSASTEAGQAAEKLKSEKWNDALTPEQQALQHILRAESTFRDIQVAFGRQGGGGGGGGQQGARDLENLADLELDREKNQFETGQQSASDKRQKEIDDAMQKLAELAKRQQELANRKPQQQDAFRQRWEQEMLRREAEQLKRQMEQLSRDSQQSAMNQQGQQSQQGGQASSSSSSSSSGQQSSQGGQQQQQQQSSLDPRIKQTLDRIQRATEDMSRAASQNGSPEQNAAAQRRAAENLQEARDVLNGMQSQQTGAQLDELARKAQQLAEQQKDFQNRLREAVGNEPPPPPQYSRRRFGQQYPQSGPTSPVTDKLATEKEQMAKDLHQLQQQMNNAARQMTDSQPTASNKLRQALGEVESNDIEAHMKANAEMIRNGQGIYAWVREPTQTQALQKLRDRLQEAQGAMQAQQQASNANGKGELERALQQMESIRSRMEQLTRGQQGQNGQNGQQGQQGRQQAQGRQPGQQPGQQGQQGQQGQPGQQPGQNGQQQGQNGQQSGQQAGQQGQPGSQGQSGGQQGGQQQAQGQPGGWSPQGGNPGGQQYGGAWNGNPGYRNGYLPQGGYLGDVPSDARARTAEQTYREALRDLNQLRQSLRDNPDLSTDVQGLMRYLQQFSYGNDAELAARLSRQGLPEVERLELEIRRKLDSSEGQVRSAGTDTVPPGYADAVADYFRKLSKGK